MSVIKQLGPKQLNAELRNSRDSLIIISQSYLNPSFPFVILHHTTMIFLPNNKMTGIRGEFHTTKLIN